MDTIDTLAARLARLERSAKRWRIAAGGLALALVAVAGVAAVAPAGTADVLRARRLELVDATGRVRLLGETGERATLTVYGPAGQRAGQLAGDADGGAVSTGGADFHGNAAVMMSEDRFGSLMDLSRQDGDRVVMQTTQLYVPKLAATVAHRVAWAEPARPTDRP